MSHVAILHGPNLNLLGMREPNIYGTQSLSLLNDQLHSLANTLGLTISCWQSNSEAALLEKIQQNMDGNISFFIINAAGLSHSSIVLRDALLAVATPFVEVHLSNIYRRESYRHHSYLSDIALGTINGLGTEGYLAALRFAHIHLSHLN